MKLVYRVRANAKLGEETRGIQMASAAPGKGNGTRWEPNTYVDGVNVGGKFKPKDGQGIVKNPEKLGEAVQMGVESAIERCKKLGEQATITAEDAIEMAATYGQVMDGATKEFAKSLATKIDAANISSQTAFMNAMYDLNIVQPPPPPPGAKFEVLFKEAVATALAAAQESAKDPAKIPDVLGAMMTPVLANSGAIWPELIFGVLLGEAMPAIVASFFTYQALAAVAEKITDTDPAEEPLKAIGQDLAMALASDAIAIGLLKIAGKGSLVGSQKLRGARKAVSEVTEQQANKIDIQAFASKARQVKDTITGVLKKVGSTGSGLTPGNQSIATSLDVAAKSARDPAHAHLTTQLAGYTASQKARVPTTKDLHHFLRSEIGDRSHSAALKSVDIDIAQLSQRLIQMADVDTIPLQHREARAKELKRLVGRVKELSSSIDQQKGIDVAKIEKAFAEEIEVARQSMSPERFKDHQIDAEREFGKMLARSHGADWRATAIKAEIAMGEQLDRILHAADISQSSGHHDKLLKNLQRHEASVDITMVEGKGVGKALSERFGMKKAKEIVSKHYSSKDIGAQDLVAEPSVSQAIHNTVNILNRLSAKPIAAKLTISNVTKSRAFTAGDFVELGGGSARIVFHEIGHIIEKENKEIYRKLAAFRSERSKLMDHAMTDMRNQGMSGEMTLVDDFARQYCGKVYSFGAHATELVATGLESLATVETTIAHLRSDREHFLLALGAVNLN